MIEGTTSGKNIKVTAQACPVTRPLGSVKEIVEAGNEVLFTKRGGAIISKHTGSRTPIVMKSGSWVVEVTVSPQKDPVELKNRWSCLACEDDDQDKHFHRQEDLI